MVQRIGWVMSKRIDLRLYGVLQRDIYQLQNYAVEAIPTESSSARMSYEKPYVSIARASFILQTWSLIFLNENLALETHHRMPHHYIFF